MTHFDQRGTHPHGAVQPDTHILIVDNDRSVSVSLGFMLAARGYEEVRSVRSAARAIAIAESFRPAIVFLDIELPDMDGLDLAHRLSRGARQNAIRLIALTNVIEHPKREDARAAGFERYLVKPLDQSELDKVLRRTPHTAA
jgi:CheY-like chemotaxis protein